MKAWLLATLALPACGDHHAPAVPADSAPIEGCPSFGTPPHFSPELHVVGTNCQDYSDSVDANLAIAACTDGLREGAIDGPLSPTPGFMPTATRYVTITSLFPEGDRMLAGIYDGTSGQYTHSIFTRTSLGWAWTNDLDMPFPQSVTTGSPRRLIALPGGPNGVDPVMKEWVGDDSTWTEVPNGAYGINADLGVRIIDRLSVTPDGLRLVFSGYATTEFQPKVFYSERPTIADRFGPAVWLDDVAASSPGDARTPFLAPDCSRIYFTSLRAVMYQSQR